MVTVCLLPQDKALQWAQWHGLDSRRTNWGAQCKQRGRISTGQTHRCSLQKDTSLACMTRHWQDDSWLSLCMASGNGFSCSMPPDSDRPGHLPPALGELSSVADLRSTQGQSQTTLRSFRWAEGAQKEKKKQAQHSTQAAAAPQLWPCSPP